MAIRRNPEPGKQAVLWLATAFVILIGAASCTFIILAAVERPTQQLYVVSALFAAVVFFLTRLATSPDRQAGNSWMRMWLAMRGKSDPKTVLRIGRKKKEVQYGTNAPPTLDSVRDAAEHNVTWVPHGQTPDRSDRKR